MFNKKIRPLLEIEIIDGPKFVAFDRIDLDSAIDEYKRTNGKLNTEMEIGECQKESPVCNTTKRMVNGVSIKELEVMVESDNVYEQALKKKQK